MYILCTEKSKWESNTRKQNAQNNGRLNWLGFRKPEALWLISELTAYIVEYFKLDEQNRYFIHRDNLTLMMYSTQTENF